MIASPRSNYQFQHIADTFVAVALEDIAMLLVTEVASVGAFITAMNTFAVESQYGGKDLTATEIDWLVSLWTSVR